MARVWEDEYGIYIVQNGTVFRPFSDRPAPALKNHDKPKTRLVGGGVGALDVDGELWGGCGLSKSTSTAFHPGGEWHPKPPIAETPEAKMVRWGRELKAEREGK